MKTIETKQAPAAIGPYSQAVEVNGTLYVSGQIPFDPVTMELVSEDVKIQTEQCLKNIDAIVKEAGYEKENIAKCVIFIKDMNDFAIINDAYAAYFGDHKPARACVEVARLPKDVQVEIDAIAVKA